MPDWPEPTTAAQGAPNIVVILLDDVGFGAASVFGGPVKTPSLEQLAAGGLRYNRFHVNSLCSPTRASLLSGRNDHSINTAPPKRSVDVKFSFEPDLKAMREQERRR